MAPAAVWHDRRYADPLPINNASPSQVMVAADVLLLLGGETGAGWIDNEYYRQHPDLALFVELSVVD